MHSGMRKSEITKLTLDRIVELDGTLFVSVIKTKSDKPRLVPCSSRMIEIVEIIELSDWFNEAKITGRRARLIIF